MREKYIKQVEKELHIPRKAKKEVIREMCIRDRIEHGLCGGNDVVSTTG